MLEGVETLPKITVKQALILLMCFISLFIKSPFDDSSKKHFNVKSVFLKKINFYFLLLLLLKLSWDEPPRFSLYYRQKLFIILWNPPLKL